MRQSLGLQTRSASDELTQRIISHFGQRFRQWLDMRGLRLVDVAEKLGLSYHYVAFIGKNKPYGRLLSAENTLLFAEIANIDPDEVFSAMCQINPLLAEKVPVEVLERELLNLHKRLRKFVEQQDYAELEEVEAEGKEVPEGVRLRGR